jgi:ATP-binding cassette, subfamily B, bacterial
MESRPLEPAPIGSGGWIKRLWPFVAAHKRDALVAFGVSVLGQGIYALVPVVERLVIDDVIVAHGRPVWPLLIILAAASLFTFGCAYVRRWFGGRVSLEVQFDLRNAIYERLQRLDFAGHDKLQTGQLVSRASSDLGLLQTLLGFLPIVVGNVVLLIVALVVMVILSPLLTLVTLVTLPILLALSMRMRSLVFPATWHAQQRSGEVAGVVDEAVTGVRVVKGFGQEDREQRRLASAAKNLFGSRVRLVKLQSKYTAGLATVPVLAQVAVLALGGWLSIHGRLSLGTFLAFSTYLVQLVAPVRMMSVVFATSQQARAGAERVLDVLDATPLVIERADALALPTVRGEVRFEGVRFGYSLKQPVLDGFDLHVRAGEIVALVGASGSGKSTVTALLPRFYDATSGRITIDGIDVRDVTLDSLRHQVGVAFEEAFLFSDTVRANIAYARPDATQHEVEAAAGAAGAHDFVEALPQGYDTVVGERGVTISGGQRQRVALARAILGDPRILVLDDATSSVDATTEEAIHDTLSTIMEGRTTILVAHRRSTLRLADRIVVIDKGRVVGDGTHEELLLSSALYRSLLAGPGEGAEGGENDTAMTDTGPLVDGRTIAAWPEPDDDVPVAMIEPGGQRQGPPGSGGMGALSATPELLARLETLPPIMDAPDVDDAAATAAPPTPFRILDYLRPWRGRLLFGFGLVVVDALLTLTGPFLIRRGLDQGVRLGNQSLLFGSAALFLAAVLLDGMVTWGYSVVTGRTAESVLYSLRLTIFGHLQRLSLDYYDRELDGRIMTRMTNDIESLSQLIQTGLVTAIVGALTCVGVFVFLLVLSPPLALVTAAMIPPLVIATVWFQRRARRSYDRSRDAIATVNANLQESLAGVRLTQASVRQDRNIGGFKSVNGAYRNARLSSQRLIAIFFPLVNVLGDLTGVLVLGAGAALTAQGKVTAPVVVAFILYVGQFFSPIQQLSQVFDTWQQASVSTSRIGELLSTPSATPPAANPIVPSVIAGDVMFDDVSFRYDGGVNDALTGISMHIRPGETVALVGETGAGKSTIVKMVARYYDPAFGRILIDGSDLRSLELGAYRRHLGVVPQEAFLFTGTVRDNIAYGAENATDAEVETAARAVGAHDFVASLPQGYRTAVSERGRSLSSGQRQLIALARALLVNPSILLLDEATSQLDLATEARVQRAMHAAAQGRTTLLVAHRLTTAASADRIFVVDAGRIVQSGSHDELLAQGGAYRALWDDFATGRPAENTVN